MVEKGWILKNDDNKIKWTKERKKERKEKKGNNEGEKKEENKKHKLKPNYKIPKIP